VRIKYRLLTGVVTWALLALNEGTAPGQVIINEVCSRNSATIIDSHGNYEDWIEILNAGTDSVNLEGYCLSDERADSGKWCFPSYLMAPDEHMLVFASGRDIKLPPMYWHTVIDRGEEWRYTIPDANTSTQWREVGFDDSSWDLGPSGFGYGDMDDATEIPPVISIFLRKTFDLEDPSIISKAVLHLDYDDAFVAFINGKEVARSGIEGNPPAYNAAASLGREATIYGGGKPRRFDLDISDNLFIQGGNVIAIQVHNLSVNSSDMSAIPFLSLQEPHRPDNPVPEILELTDTHYHTSFKLDADGEVLFLTGPQGFIIDSLEIPFLDENHSYGRKEGELNRWVLFVTPTPGEPNVGESFEGYLEDIPRFTPPGGRFQSSFQLALSSENPADTIYYTLDGSNPDAGSFIYNDPIGVDSDMVVRARIVRTGYLPGKIVSHTYFSGTDHHLPVVAISTDPYNLWDYNYGIYAMGPHAESEFPYFNANFWQDWERPAHVEFYDEEGNPGFSLDAGIKIYGGWTRGHPQKSMAIFARSRYGAGKIEYRLFREKPITEFESFVIRNSGNDWFGKDSESGTMIRDILMTRLTAGMDLEYQAARQAIIYINGEYWGIQNIREKISEYFVASNRGVDPARIDMLEGNQYEIHGSNEHYAEMIDFLSSNDISLQENYDYIKTRMDVQNFINYQLSEIFFDNTDWPSNNIKYWRPSSPNGRWRWILYDTDFGFGLWDLNKVYNNTLEFATEPDGPPDYPNPPWSTFLLRRLLENQEFRYLFINSFADRINSTFSADSVKDLIQTLKDGIDEEMFLHVQRWGGSYQNWINRTYDPVSFANLRPSAMLNHIWNTMKPGEKHQLTFDVSDAGAGSVKLNTIFVRDFPWKGIYFNDVPVTVTAVPEPGYRFTGWTGDISSSAPSISFNPAPWMTVVANFEADPDNPENPVIINEICYVQDSVADSGDWVELYNHSDRYVDISGWVLKDSDNTHSYTVRPGTLMAPGGYHVICRDRYAFETVYPGVTCYEGGFAFGFSSQGEVIRLFNASMEMVDYVNYGITNPWPFVAPGSGQTIVLLDPALDNSLPGSWGLSQHPYGTPGGNNSFNLDIEQHTPDSGGDILFRASPNPFTSETRIIFHSGSVQRVRIAVYDMNGRFIDLLADRTLETGYHEFTWRPGNNEPGLYILRLETPGSVMTRRIVRIR
jgi:hypothetical protein